ncbi:ataxin-1a [Dunckerocampus dactyliophorus]|uniref:ataxin-1a n=1 Tax=Dunckerocampus dactyliophorus TaxID=161453 RepID=UPI002405242D|nr:ataxin-1a [Dunckerocampus dactyliophorus]XP_054620215.1 ataxin-1a [Dunckerocampus dactyliophorus]XP_054620216.1 ataxin-1a [Dunckerocampus dactyliophorus]XP_054620218.1 ataxin-1a [Dunckerocampus dactyliophorus]XP_054620219.1 ataxin-1a [Dunckerocampus dactyliophorus]
MKSNQERSNECLPPKKRELPSENRSPTVPPAPDPQRPDNVAWLVAGGNGSTESAPRSSAQSDNSQYKSLSSASDSSSMTLVSSLPTVYTSPLSQTNVGGMVHYAQLPPNLQFITSPYSAPYASYIAPQLLPPPPPPPPLSSSSYRSTSHTETASAPSHASKYDHQRVSIRHTSTMPPPPTDATPHRASPRTLRSPQSLHVHHTAASQYPDGGTTRKEEGGSRELHNGGLERSRRFEARLSKPIKSRDAYESCQLVLPSDYSHDPLALRTSVMLMPNSHGDHQPVPARSSPEKTSAHLEKGSILLGKPIHRTSLSSTPSFTFPPPLSVDNLKAAVGPLSPQTVIQTTHNSTVDSMGLPSTGVYPQSPVIGYIAGASSSQHTPISYHTSLQQHVLITGAQPVIIPVSGSGVAALEPTTSQVVTSSTQAPFPAALPHTYIAATRGEAQDNPGVSYHHVSSGGVVQAQLHLPVVPSTAPPPQSSTAAPPSSLPPYFVKGSIIQLADGELKRVEELKTEDFIQSAEISRELKIDSSTVERIEGSHASPDLAVVQFSVGEHRAQVSVEVLVEYPFFVFGQGWSSCCPERTTKLLELPCTKLSVGDVCISLTLKNLRNGSLTRTHPPELAPSMSAPASSRGHPRAPKPLSNAPQRCSGGGSRHGERENGVGQRGRDGSGNGGSSGGAAVVQNGNLAFGERGSRLISKDELAEPGKCGMSSGGRKRRWSAPEGRKVEKSDEPPLTLAKPFIPHEVKVTIEGRSNIGK